jgi:hypothetical protein
MGPPYMAIGSFTPERPPSVPWYALAASRGMDAQIIRDFLRDWHPRYARVGAVRDRGASFGPGPHEAPPTRRED